MAIDKVCNEISCTGCELCAQICQKSAIEMKPDSEGFMRPAISDACIECGLCRRKCPANTEQDASDSEFYMGWHRNDDVVMNSSSGGIFTAIADYVLSRGGCVFGAALDQSTGELRHRRADNKRELEALRKSKYFQSRIGDAYIQAKKALEMGTLVLFTGTICQIAGLLSYLGNKSYENLITVDVLCHGVASKKVVDEYRKSMEKREKSKIKEINFRIKEGKNGWQKGSGTRMRLDFENGKSFVAERAYDHYFMGFNNNYFLRESCYNCKYCGTKRISDFTLADFWGCKDNRVSEAQMKKGVSLVLVNSEKAKKILCEIEDTAQFYRIDKNDAIAKNLALVKPQPRPEIRDRFFDIMNKKGYVGAIEKIMRKRFVKYKVKKIIGKVLPYKIGKKLLKNP